MLSIGKVWLFLFTMTLFALIPDIVLKGGKFVLRPNPDDQFLKLERRKASVRGISYETPKFNFHFSGYCVNSDNNQRKLSDNL
jgi:hypothetical protein